MSRAGEREADDDYWQMLSHATLARNAGEPKTADLFLRAARALRAAPPPEGGTPCPHDLAERETAVADGMCPLCMAADRR